MAFPQPFSPKKVSYKTPNKKTSYKIFSVKRKIFLYFLKKANFTFWPQSQKIFSKKLSYIFS